MFVTESCALCLYDKQKKRSGNDQPYLREVKDIIAQRRETDTAPYLIWKFAQAYEKLNGRLKDYSEEKLRFNDLLLSMEGDMRKELRSYEDPLAAAVAYARTGNYIDFGALNEVDTEEFLGLFKDSVLSEKDMETYHDFRRDCEKAKNFLLVADNCGEIVLDKLMLEILHEEYPLMKITVLVRGREVLNDVTYDDAVYAGIDNVAEIIGNGEAIAGTIYETLPHEAKQAVDTADVILSKGQANYESLSRQGRHIYYSFLCKCDLFTSRFNVPLFTGIFVSDD